jgi:hypothetical protein
VRQRVGTPSSSHLVFGTLCLVQEVGCKHFSMSLRPIFDARVSVFRGSCSSLECVELDDSLHWDSIAGELYYMLVRGADGSSGNFGLFVDLGNAFCTDVVNPLPIDGTTFGGTVIGIGPNASSTDGLPLCELYPLEPSPGLVTWFF